jgi:hypothetical protein
MIKDDGGLDSWKPHSFLINRLPLKSIYMFLMSKKYQKVVSVLNKEMFFFAFNTKQPILSELIPYLSSIVVKELLKSLYQFLK